MRKLILILLVALLALPVFAQTDISYGDTVTGEISDAAPEARYTFTGSAGDVIIIRMNSTDAAAGLDSYVQLLNSDGIEIFSDDDGGGNLNSLLGPFSLPSDGTYTIVATRCCGGGGTSVGPFELALEQSELIEVALNETYTIDLAGETLAAFFNYTGAGNEILSIQGTMTAGSQGVNIEIRGPNGEYLSGGYVAPQGVGGVDVVYAEAPGSYLVTLRSDAFYTPADQRPADVSSTLQLTFTGAETEAIVRGTPAVGELNDENPADYYSFTASAGSIFRLIGSETGGDPFEVQVYGPEGYSINGGATAYNNPPGTFTIDPLQLSSDGEYLILVRRLNVNGPSPEGLVSGYSLDLSETETPILEAGIEASDMVGGEVYERVYRFNGVEGQGIRVTLRSVDDAYAPSLNVQGPTAPAGTEGGFGGGGSGGFLLSFSGTQPGTATYELKLPITGVYIFRVNNGSFNFEGPSMGTFGLLVEVVE